MKHTQRMRNIVSVKLILIILLKCEEKHLKNNYFYNTVQQENIIPIGLTLHILNSKNFLKLVRN